MVNLTKLEAIRNDLKKPRQLFIDGKYVEAQSGRRIDIIDPATEEKIASVAEAGSADIDVAVAAAKRSFDQQVWRGMQVDQRMKVMWRLADLLEKNAEEIAYVETLNAGMPHVFAQRSVLGAAGWLRHFSGSIKRISGRVYSESISAPGDWHSYTRREPVGVVATITPWNGPLATIIIKTAPALAAGCSCVCKPSELTPLTALIYGELAMEAGLPKGVLNIVPGYGTEAGAALAAHPDVNKISFTGSTAVGKELVRQATGNLKRVTLELGGKSPNIVFDDADMDIAIPGAAMAIFRNSGQVCLAGSRLFVQRKVFDKVIAGVAEIANALKIGNGLSDATEIGPLISQKQRDRVMGYIQSGIQEGAEVVAGGGKRDGKGFFVEPTVFVKANRDMKMIREEIFGPVVSATPFDTVDELPVLANDTNYGLASGIFSTNLANVHQTAKLINAGNVYVNCYSMFDAVLPFGGYKESGWGRELGDEGLDAYLETKSVHIKVA